MKKFLKVHLTQVCSLGETSPNKHKIQLTKKKGHGAGKREARYFKNINSRKTDSISARRKKNIRTSGDHSETNDFFDSLKAFRIL
jgi:hypothetical protein